MSCRSQQADHAERGSPLLSHVFWTVARFEPFVLHASALGGVMFRLLLVNRSNHKLGDLAKRGGKDTGGGGDA